MPRHTLFLIVFVALFTGRLASAAEPDTKPAFNADIRPIFKAHCTECHGETEKPKGGLDLRLRRTVLKGGKSGSVVAEGNPSQSLLLDRVTSGEMPPGQKKLSATEIDTLKKWIAAGAKVEAPEPETLALGFVITNNDRQWWAFQQVKRPAVPTLSKQSSQISNPIDEFLLASLSDKGLSFSQPADRVALIRRTYFDLIGLPPTMEEVSAFVNDKFPHAYEKLVDKLLASPQYGERWGRHWLDVAGYADSEGGSPEDLERTNAWKYRDYVIHSFNADKPFDRFIKEQLAGDELVKPPYAELRPVDLDSLIATGFLRMAPDGSGAAGVDQKLARNQVLTDTVKITASAFMGVTVGCAQCHNHRYDPIPQADFYRLRAAFEPGYDLANWIPPASRQVSLYTDAEKKKAAEVEAEAAKIDKDRLKKQNEFIEATFEKELAKLPKEEQPEARSARETPEAKRSPAQKKLMQQHPSLNVSAGSLYLYDSKAAAELKKMSDAATEVRKKKPVEEFVRALTETPGKVPITFLHHRGDPDQPKDAIPPGGLSVLDGPLPLKAPDKPLPTGTTGRRLALANWLIDPRHPLTARVLVNRVWMLHFGKGLVGTPGDFGRLGEKPTHPELLDWLASEFIENGWSLKKLHHLILTSTAYRQSSTRDQKTDSLDPDNRLLSRFPLRRLDAESVRDAMLAISGKLNPKPFGPPVPVMEDDAGLIVIGKANRDGAQYKLGDESVPPGEESRRSVYVQVRRSKPLGVLGAFDGATSEPNCEARNSSTATPQALLLLNGEFATLQAEAFAARVRKEVGPELKEQVSRAWVLAYLRQPTEKELASTLAFLLAETDAFRKQPTPAQVPPKAGTKAPEPVSAEMRALAVFCQALLCSNRFLYVE
ncbi:MAG TPA: PSD1 and planctomycete cytochrome C domain-containing protein [Gemmata sp.]|jgi:mono/diheme cytochrome c family protein|nr:PSD1 and planctomycete cytochrome C domain-containing protein [Gemmata sp.]